MGKIGNSPFLLLYVSFTHYCKLVVVVSCITTGIYPIALRDIFMNQLTVVPQVFDTQ